MSKNSRDQFSDRFRSFQIPEKEINRMYEREVDFQMHLQWMSEQALANQQSGVTSSPAGGGAEQSEESLGPCIQFVVNTTSGVSVYFDVTTSSDTTYTVNWGDGTNDSGDLIAGITSLSYTYQDIDTEYTVQLCFGDPLSVTGLDFQGND